MCTTEYIKYSQTILNIIIPMFFGFIGWIANVMWEKSKYKREQKTYYWKEKINAGKKATEFYFEYLNLLNLIRSQFNLFKKNMIDEQSLLVEIQQREIEFYSNKLKQFPHFEYHHINLFYDLVDDKNYQIIIENNELFQEISKLIKLDNFNVNDISELYGKIESNYEIIYKNIIYLIKKTQKDLELEVK